MKEGSSSRRAAQRQIQTRPLDPPWFCFLPGTNIVHSPLKEGRESSVWVIYFAEVLMEWTTSSAVSSLSCFLLMASCWAPATPQHGHRQVHISTSSEPCFLVITMGKLHTWVLMSEIFPFTSSLVALCESLWRLDQRVKMGTQPTSLFPSCVASVFPLWTLNNIWASSWWDDRWSPGRSSLRPGLGHQQCFRSTP